ncbi:MAG: hypothetical protein M3M85_03535 [bacterium]|nr:hypothetical protein [bacterium]
MGKIKGFIESEKGKDILVVLIVILVGLGSFELGRLSKGNQSGGITIEYTDQASLEDSNLPAGAIYANKSVSAPAPAEAGTKGYFASSRGTKYYPADCSAGQSIKESNKVWFDTRDLAERAGYELSSSCR